MSHITCADRQLHVVLYSVFSPSLAPLKNVRIVDSTRMIILFRLTKRQRDREEREDTEEVVLVDDGAEEEEEAAAAVVVVVEEAFDQRDATYITCVWSCLQISKTLHLLLLLLLSASENSHRSLSRARTRV